MMHPSLVRFTMNVENAKGASQKHEARWRRGSTENFKSASLLAQDEAAASPRAALLKEALEVAHLAGALQFVTAQPQSDLQ